MIVPSSCRELPGLLGNIKKLQYSIEKTNVLAILARDTSIPVSFERGRVNETEIKNNLDYLVELKILYKIR